MEPENQVKNVLLNTVLDDVIITFSKLDKSESAQKVQLVANKRKISVFVFGFL